MPRFRPQDDRAASGPTTDLLAVSEVIEDVLQPGNFLVAPEVTLAWVAAQAETIPWEIFRGRLLDAAQTRRRQSFLSWHVCEQESALLSIKLDVSGRCVHVTRGLTCHVWEGYDAGGGVMESRNTVRWTCELVGSIGLDAYDLDHLRDELICLLWQSLVGASRLPLTSVEAPLPAFVFGQVHYLYRANAGSMPATSWEDALAQGLSMPLDGREFVKLVEFTLRRGAPTELPRLAEVFAAGWTDSLPRLLRSLFNNVSLSPYTDFVEKTLAWVGLLTEGRAGSAALQPVEEVDFLGYLLRQLGRHLTAYDLVTFHHRGANYPDALLLDAVLKAYLRRLDEHGDWLVGDEARARRRRRALRQGCLLRRHYEGHLVPDRPTSPGENARVMPAYARVDEDQLSKPHRRRRQLFVSDPLAGLLNSQARRVLAESVRDLVHLEERLEMGVGIFIDRPLGYSKAPAEPDQTPLLAHEAFSPSLARRRAQELHQMCRELNVPLSDDVRALFEMDQAPDGLPSQRLADSPRPVAALCDVRRVADDFVVMRTLPGGLADLLDAFDWSPLLQRYRLPFLASRRVRWCVQVHDERNKPFLALFDAEGRHRLDLLVDGSKGYVVRAGVETPLAGLQAVMVWEDTDDPALLTRHDLSAAPYSVVVFGR